MHYLLLGKEMIKNLRDKIVVLCIDEAHVCLRSQWGHSEMREEMNLAPAYLRAQLLSSTKAPVLAMTASAKVNFNLKNEKDEVEEIKEMCSLKYSPTTVVAISPVLHNHLYVNIMKPPSCYGFYGRNCYSFSEQKVGSVHVLWRIYLKYFVSDLVNGKIPKKAIIYVEKFDNLNDIDDFLTDQLGHLDIVKNVNTCPWVTNSSATGCVEYCMVFVPDLINKS